MTPELLLLALVPVGFQAEQGQLPPPAAPPVDFSRDFTPILARACYSCHGAEK